MIEMIFVKFWEKDEIKKTHLFLQKHVLGVNKRCPNVAARDELGIDYL